MNEGKIKKELQLPENSPIVGVIATLRPRKGHQDFLNAAAHVLEAHPQAVFLLVGRDGGSRSHLEALAEKLGISHSVFFTGERDDIPELLSIIDVQVCCSYYEGLSNAILEGMAAGKSIIATNIAGNPELVVHGQTGLIVPPGEPQHLAEAILRLLHDKTLRNRMGKSGRQRVEKLFRVDQMVHATESFYQYLVDTNTTNTLCHITDGQK
jgi:glycosyltransferase involved in cell wall biosynthesis